MRQVLIVVVAAVALLVCTNNSLSQSRPAQSLTTKPDSLRLDNQKLQQRLKDLEKKLAENDKLIEKFEKSLKPPATQPFGFRFRVVPPTTRPFPSRDWMPNAGTLMVPDPKNPPKDWIKKEFNGEPFYIIPCK
ncbi:MAG TPA: hypothetical protein VF669_04920 [Tepidisphaeraceae bacterium]|jgi:hypothetical protein